MGRLPLPCCRAVWRGGNRAAGKGRLRRHHLRFGRDDSVSDPDPEAWVGEPDPSGGVQRRPVHDPRPDRAPQPGADQNPAHRRAQGNAAVGAGPDPHPDGQAPDPLCTGKAAAQPDRHQQTVERGGRAAGRQHSPGQHPRNFKGHLRHGAADHPNRLRLGHPAGDALTAVHRPKAAAAQADAGRGEVRLPHPHLKQHRPAGGYLRADRQRHRRGPAGAAQGRRRHPPRLRHGAGFAAGDCPQHQGSSCLHRGQGAGTHRHQEPEDRL